MTIRWLHLSDIHECSREEHFRKGMYAEIVAEVRLRPTPDLVFLTGDFAFGGQEAEYESLRERLIDPLRRILPDGCPIFTVPGNHDVDRKRSSKPRVWMSDAEDAKAFQAIDKDGAAKRRDLLLVRFAAYASFDRAVSTWGSDWLASEAGAACWTGDINRALVAVVGVNTAWLCQDDEDWGKLTSGRYMLETVLDAAQARGPDLLIVLGHHPLDALSVEGEPGDGPRVKERLKQANALYLHGHLHASGNDRIGDALRSMLTIQAPSAFQAHDDKRWRNGLMWGEADLATGSLLVEPRLWNEDKREYKFDAEAGYEKARVAGRDAFWIRPPSRAAADPPPEPKSVSPPGWQRVDRAALEQTRARRPEKGEMIAFFDGLLPTWRLALAPGVRPRAIAEQLANRLRAAHGGPPKPLVLLLAGAGGEGKSTVLLHAAAALVEDERQSWTCLHRESAAAALPGDLFAGLPEIAGHAWVAVIDDADNVGHEIIAAMRRLAPRTDVHLLLAAREADWRMRKLVPGIWEGVAQLQQVTLAGLDEGDAQSIVGGWCAYGDEAMGRLRGATEERASAALLGHARDFATRKEEGALLGALLVTRQGEDMRAHVRSMLGGLAGRPVVWKFSLRDIYAMVAAMHAENQLYLSRSVLAFAIGCEQDVLERDVLDVLRQEAMLDAGDIYILTRHRRIAEAACAAIREDHGDVDQWFPFLAAAALRHFLSRRPTPEIAQWCNSLSEYFVDKGGRWEAGAVKVAKALYDADPKDGHLLTGYASVLRRTGRAPEAMAVLKAAGERFRNNSGVLYEWGTVAGAVVDHGLNAWLAGRSLADGGTLDKRGHNLALSGLSAAFRELSAVTGNRAFTAAQAVCGQLGLRLPEVDPKARGIFEKEAAEGGRQGVADLSPEKAVATIREAVILGAAEVEPDNDPVYFEGLLGDPESYRYTSLLRLISGKSRPSAEGGKRRGRT